MIRGVPINEADEVTRTGRGSRTEKVRFAENYLSRSSKKIRLKTAFKDLPLDNFRKGRFLATVARKYEIVNLYTNCNNCSQLSWISRIISSPQNKPPNLRRLFGRLKEFHLICFSVTLTL